MPIYRREITKDISDRWTNIRLIALNYVIRLAYNADTGYDSDNQSGKIVIKP